MQTLNSDFYSAPQADIVHIRRRWSPNPQAQAHILPLQTPEMVLSMQQMHIIKCSAAVV